VQKLALNQQDDERTVVRFSLDQSGDIHDVNQLQKRLTPYELEF
jgi:hypothetical protein